MKVWNEIEDRLEKAPTTNKAKEKYLFVTSYYGKGAELDGQGRVLLPPVLRESAQLRGDVDVLGKLNYLEVMNHERVMDQMQKDPYTDEDDKALEGLGI